MLPCIIIVIIYYILGREHNAKEVMSKNAINLTSIVYRAFETRYFGEQSISPSVRPSVVVIIIITDWSERIAAERLTRIKYIEYTSEFRARLIFT